MTVDFELEKDLVAALHQALRWPMQCSKALVLAKGGEPVPRPASPSRLTSSNVSSIRRRQTGSYCATPFAYTAAQEQPPLSKIGA